jgi:hypothetical protein
VNLSTGRSSSLSLGNGLTETRLFDARYFPDRIQVPGGLDWDYTVDAVGNVTSIADGLTPSASRSFTYQDRQYFLTQASGPWPTLAWTYDKIGDRLTETQTGEPLPFTYTYSGATPKLLQIQPRPHGNDSASGLTYLTTDHLGTPVLATDTSGASLYEVVIKCLRTAERDGSLELALSGVSF